MKRKLIVLEKADKLDPLKKYNPDINGTTTFSNYQSKKTGIKHSNRVLTEESLKVKKSKKSEKDDLNFTHEIDFKKLNDINEFKKFENFLQNKIT